jgi:hypothetical protein
MRAPGIIGLLQLAVPVAFALPVGLFGLSWLIDGRVLGIGFVAVAILMVAVPYAVTNPLDPGDVAEAAVERVVDDE